MCKFLIILCLSLSLFAEEMVEVLSRSPLIILYHDFLSEKECNWLIREARPHLARSTVVGDTPSGSKVDRSRTSEGMFFFSTKKGSVLDGIEKRIAAVTMLPRENGENIQVLHYSPGEEYLPHYDYFNPHSSAEKRHLDRGGQRLASFLMYLHTTEEGGETIFPRLDIKVKPVRGDALLFYNCDAKGVVDTRTLHGGAPVIRGEKWIATRWIRQGKFD